MAATASVAYFGLEPYLEVILSLGNRLLLMSPSTTAEMGRLEKNGKPILIGACVFGIDPSDPVSWPRFG